MTNLGGYREGAGRPAGSGKYGEKTYPIRIPIGLLPTVKLALKVYIKRKISNEKNKHTRKRDDVRSRRKETI